MLNTITTIGHKASAFTGSYIYARTKQAALTRAIVSGTAFGGIFLLATTEMAHATTDLNKYLTDSTNKTNVIVDVISYAGYIGGALMAALGIVDLKNHVQNPQTPIKIGLAKLGFGALLLAIPFVTELMANTAGGKGTGAEYKNFTAKPKIGS